MFRLTILLLCAAFCLAKSGGKISGGSETAIQGRPFQLVILWGSTPYCSGAIISEYWAITSGLCANGPGKKQTSYILQPEHMRLKAGSSDWEGGGTLHQVQTIILHEFYNMEFLFTPDYDLALMRVDEPFVLAVTTIPISLADEFPDYDDEMVVSGWGSTTFRRAQVQIVEQRDCVEAYASFPFDAKITDRMICTVGFRNEGDGPCGWDDLGSILTANDKLIGIVSNPTCGYEDQPSVYANTVMLRDWIREQSGV